MDYFIGLINKKNSDIWMVYGVHTKQNKIFNDDETELTYKSIRHRRRR